MGAFRPVFAKEGSGVVINSESRVPRKTQQGVWEFLFCAECEGLFNSLEAPFIRFWKHPSSLPATLDGRYVTVKQVDYENTKRLLLSVLWRAHISSRTEFIGVQLGPHAESIHDLLRSPKPMPESKYQVLAVVLRDEATGGPNREVLVTPAKHRVAGNWSYVMAFFGIGWIVLVSSHKTSLPQSLVLKSDTDLILPIVNTRDFGPVGNILGPSMEPS